MKQVKQHINLIKYIALSLMLMLMGVELSAQAGPSIPLINVKNGAKVYFGKDAPVIVNGSIQNETGSIVGLNGKMKVYGSWTNNGTQSAYDGSLIEFFGPNNADITGSGHTEFFRILVNKENKEVILTLTAVPSNTPANGFVELAKGLFRVACPIPHENVFLVAGENGYLNIPVDAQFWLDAADVVVKPQAFDILLKGTLKVLQGKFNAGKMLFYANEENDKRVAELDIQDAVLNVARGIRPLGNAPQDINFTMNEGALDNKKATLNLHTNEAAYSADPLAENYALWVEGENSNASLQDGAINVNADFGYDYGKTTLKVKPKNAEGKNVILNVFNNNENAPQNTAVHIDSKAEYKAFNINFKARNQSAVVESDLVINGDITISGNDENMLVSKAVTKLLGNLEIVSLSETPILCDNENSAIEFGDDPLGKAQLISTQTANLNLQYLRITKNVSEVSYGASLTNLNISNELRLNGESAILDVGENTISMPFTAKVSTGEAGNLTHPNEFSNKKYIRLTGATTQPESGGKMIRTFAEAGNMAETKDIVYPIGDAAKYAPAMLKVYQNVQYTPGQIVIRTIPQVHPAIKKPAYALHRYWNVKNEVTFAPANPEEGVGEARFIYPQDEVNGVERRYLLARYFPAWNDPNGDWDLEPGKKLNEVDYLANSIDSRDLPAGNYDGDWTAGEEKAFYTIYYSRADGNFSDPNTWSNEDFGGPAAVSAPDSKNDVIYILGNTVTLDKDANAALVEVRKATPERTAGIIKLNDENTISGGEFVLEEGTSIYINSAKGIYLVPEELGHIQTEKRTFSGEASYYYVGGSAQITGTGLPAQVKNLTIHKTPGTAVVELTRNTYITEKLHIEDGIFKVNTNIIDGSIPDRIFTMNGGEFVISNTFPLNYAPPVFTKGTVNFSGRNPVVIPSDQSVPAVAQYHNLKISADHSQDAHEVKFEPIGEIKIGNDFDLSQFVTRETNNVSNLFITKGSTVVFNADTEEQDIPIYYNSPGMEAALTNITYNKVVLRGTGKKKLFNIHSATFTSYGWASGLTTDTLVFEPNSKLHTDGNNITIGKFWDDRGGTLVTDNQQSYNDFQNPSIIHRIGNTVYFEKRRTSPLDPAYISIAKPENYAFHKVEINKATKVQTDIRVRDIKLQSKLIAEGNQKITVYGNWTQDTASANTFKPMFVPGNSTVEFAQSNLPEEGYHNGMSLKNTITVAAFTNDSVFIGDNVLLENKVKDYIFGEEKFHNVVINNPAGVDVKVGRSKKDENKTIFGGIYAKGDLNLKNGVLSTRSNFNNVATVAVNEVDKPTQYVKVDNAIARTNGFVDGRLRAKIPVGVTSFKFEVGKKDFTGENYLPVTLNTEGEADAGKEGYLDVRITDNDRFITNNGFVIPNPGIKRNKLYKYSHYIEIPLSAQGFELGKRTYNAQLTINTSALADPNGARLLTFASAKRKYEEQFTFPFDETMWYKPFSYENATEPFVGGRTDNSITLSKLNHFGLFILGQGSATKYYSRVANGNWEDPNSWSFDYYNGAPATSYPGSADSRECEVYIGYQHLIKLNTNININKGVGDAANSGVYLDSIAGGGKLHIVSRKDQWGNIIMSGTQTTLSGSGKFRMLANSWLKIEHPEGIAPGAGCVRMNEVDFNYENHNQSSFEYYSTHWDPTSSGVGIPSIVKSLKIQRGTIKMDKAVTITDSLYLDEMGKIDLTSANLVEKRMYLLGNLRLGKNSVINMDAAGAFVFAGDKMHQYVTLDESAINSSERYEFKVRNLHIDKPIDSSQVIFKRGEINGITNNHTHKIQIDEGELRFTARNLASIKLEYEYLDNAPVYGNGDWYLEIQPSARILRLPAATEIRGSFVDGELRKEVTTAQIGNAQGVKFEVGSNHKYRPYETSMQNATTGMLAVHQISQYHPKAGQLAPDSQNANSQGYPKDLMLEHYWRVMRPEYSSFRYNGSNMWIALNYLVPEDIPVFAAEPCFEINMHKGPVQGGWVNVQPNSSYHNFPPSTAVMCPGKYRKYSVLNPGYGGHPSSGFPYSGQNRSKTKHIHVTDVSLPLADYNLGGGRILLGDYIVAELGRGPKIFYSKRDGNWTDPNTWVTGSYESNVNIYNKYPDEREDIVYIGNGVTVNLDGDIGTGWTGYTNTPRFAAIQRLGGLTIETYDGKPGRLNARCFRIRAAKFNLKDGGIVETGYLGGLPQAGNRGNFINQSMHGWVRVPISKDYNFGYHNNANIIYKPYGRIAEDDRDNQYIGLRNFYDPIGENNSTHPRITRVSVYQNGNLIKTVDGLTRMDYGYSKETTSKNFDLEMNGQDDGASTTFEVEFDVENMARNRTFYFKIHADQNFDLELESVSPQQSFRSATETSTTIRLPVQLYNGMEHGTTVMRIYCMNRQIPDNIEYEYNTLYNNARMREIPSSAAVRSDIKDFLISINRSPLDNRPLVLNALPGIPDKIGSFKVESWEDKTLDTATVNRRAPIVNLGDNTFYTKDSLVINHGYLRYKSLDVGGKVINRFHQNSLIDYTAANIANRGTINVMSENGVSFIGEPYERADNIENFTSYNINNVNIAKKGQEVLIQNKPLRVENELNFKDDRLVNVVNSSLILGTAATINSTNGSFSDARMIKTYDDTNDEYGTVRKEGVQRTASDQNPLPKNITLTFPIGARGQYTPAEVDFKMSASTEMQNGDWTYVQLTSVPKPADTWVFATNTLDIMWKMAVQGNLVAANNNIIKMHYLPKNIRGDITKYLPGRYTGDHTNAQWDIDLGVNPIAHPSPITLSFVSPYGPSKLNGYYTAGELTSLKERLVFYNRTKDAALPNTGTYSWFRRQIWSTDEQLKHSGGPSSYFPGELTTKDVVNIDNGHIVFGVEPSDVYGTTYKDDIRRRVQIDSIHLGNTDVLSPGQLLQPARLTFPNRKANELDEERRISVNKSVYAANASVTISGGNRKDVLSIKDSLENESTFHLFSRNTGATENMSVIFNGAGTSVIKGEGLWDIDYTSIILEKEGGLLDSLVIKSTTYAELSRNASVYVDGNIPNGNDNNYAYPQSSMKLLRGVLRNDSKTDMYVSGHLFIGEGAGLHLRDNSNFYVNLGLIVGPDPARRTTDLKQTVLIDGKASLFVGIPHNPSNKALNKREMFIHENSDVHLMNGNIFLYSSLKLKENGKLTIDNTFSGSAANDISIGEEPQSQRDDLIATKFLAVEDSEFNMHGGRLIIRKNNTVNNDQAVMIVSSRNGVGFEGGSVEIGNHYKTGEVRLQTPIKYNIRCNIPFNNLTFIANSTNHPNFLDNMAETNFLDERVVIKGNLLTYRNFMFKTGISDIILGGGLSIYGGFDALSGSGDKSARVFEFNGEDFQHIDHTAELEGLEFYNVRVNKPNEGQNLNLNPAGHGKVNIIIRNALEFAEGNQAILSTMVDSEDDYFKRAVYFKPLVGVQVAQYVVRNGLGHIYGTQVNYMRSEATSTRFHVGGPNISSYHPMTVATSGTNSEGYLSGTFTEKDPSESHPKVGNGVDYEIIKQGTDIKKYWTLEPFEAFGSNQFALLADNSYTLRVDYPEGTLKGNFDLNEGMMYMYSRSVHGYKIPGFNGNPANDKWDETETDSVRTTMAISRENTKFGDIIIAEQDGLKFYSRKTGLWSDVNTWSHVEWGRGTQTVAKRIPNRKSDRVYISQAHKVTIQEDNLYSVGEVVVKNMKYIDPQGNINTNREVPGELEINGRYNRLITRKFVLEDKTKLYLENAYGICEPKVDKGAIYARKSAHYGISHYLYTSNEGPQSTGVGLPDKVLSITQDNSTQEQVSRLLTMFNESGKPQLQIYGFLNVHQGKFDPNGRNLEVNGGIKTSRGRFDGLFDGGKVDITLRPQNAIGLTENMHYSGVNLDLVQLIINNKSGLQVHNLRVNGLTKLLSDTTYTDAYHTQNLTIKNELTRLIPRGPFSLAQQGSAIDDFEMPVMIIGARVNVVVSTSNPDAIRNVKINAVGDTVNATDDDAERAIFYMQKEFSNSSNLSASYKGNRPYIIRKVMPGATYNYFLTSSGHGPANEFSGSKGIPLNLFQTARVHTQGGEPGFIGMTTQAGSMDNQYKPHFKITPRNKAVYNRRFWSIDSITYTGNVKLEFYNQLYDISPDFNTTHIFDKLSRYNVPQEGPGGKIKINDITEESMKTAGRWKGTAVALQDYLPVNEIKGDWLLSNRYALQRIFYSFNSGRWNRGTTWTFDPTHESYDNSGNEYPNEIGDSVIIGRRHTVDVVEFAPFTEVTAEGTGLMVGYPAPEFEDYEKFPSFWSAKDTTFDKTGTLTLNINDDQKFVMGKITVNNGSQIATFSKKGFSKSNFYTLSKNGLKLEKNVIYNYKRIGKENQDNKQILGDQIEGRMGRLRVQTQNGAYLEMDKDITTAWGWELSGKLVMRNHRILDEPHTNNVQTHTVNEKGWVTIGVPGEQGRSFTDALQAEKVWKDIKLGATVEFAGINHDLSTTHRHIGGGELADAFNFNMLVSGTGNTEADNIASYFDKDITILGNLTIKPIDNAINNVLPKVVVKDLITVSVHQSVSNYGHLENNGIVEVGVCE